MPRTIEGYDSHAWTGEDDFVEIKVMPIAIIGGGLVMLLIGLFI